MVMGEIVRALGPVTYEVEVSGRKLKRHVDHIRQAAGKAAQSQGDPSTPQDNDDDHDDSTASSSDSPVDNSS